ncbi:MAG: hypothetical protein HDT48_01430 [Ruminococcaceae bacterium]|nr:hypothetical protein [Oscillospiraceae bacterium]
MDIFNRKKLAEAKAKLDAANDAIDKLQEKLNNVEQTYVQKLHDSEEYIDNLKNTNNVCRSIRNQVMNTPKQVNSVYRVKESFMSWCENKLYIWLCEIAYSDEFKKEGLSVFSKVRLADIVELWEECYSKKEEDQRGVFTDSIEFSNGKVNYGKKSVNDLILEKKPDYDNQCYRITFTYPIFDKHVDFLICRSKGDGIPEPILVIELYDSRHFDSKNKTLVESDKFKENLFGALKLRFDNSLRNDDVTNSNKSEELLNKLKAKIVDKFHESIRINDEVRIERAEKYNKKPFAYSPMSISENV